MLGSSLWIGPKTDWIIVLYAQAARKKIEAGAAAAAAAAEKQRQKEALKAKKDLEKAQKVMEREEEKAAKQALRLAQKEVGTVPCRLVAPRHCSALSA